MIIISENGLHVLLISFKNIWHGYALSRWKDQFLPKIILEPGRITMSEIKFPTLEEIEGEQLENRPGRERNMELRPIFENESYPGYKRLEGKTAIVTGGDSGIGRAVAVAYAKEGCNVAIVYKEEGEDAQEVLDHIERNGARGLGIRGDVSDPSFCSTCVEQVINHFNRLDILVNNAGEQHPQKSILDISNEQLEQTFRTNIFSMFYMVKEALPHLKEGSSIINTSSITAFAGNPKLLDYSSTKGAISSFTRSLAINLAEKKIRVNQVAPGPVWTPLIPSTFSEEHVEKFGGDTPFERPGQPIELAEAYVFLAWERASSFISGQTIHINGGKIVNG
jgi:NAD(P)-dependent dehydrogenase (short-subunit alcohol dehydrogenase family)